MTIVLFVIGLYVLAIGIKLGENITKKEIEKKTLEFKNQTTEAQIEISKLKQENADLLKKLTFELQMKNLSENSFSHSRSVSTKTNKDRILSFIKENPQFNNIGVIKTISFVGPSFVGVKVRNYVITKFEKCFDIPELSFLRGFTVYLESGHVIFMGLRANDKVIVISPNLFVEEFHL